MHQPQHHRPRKGASLSVTVSHDKDGYRINYTPPGGNRTCMRGRRLGLKTKRQCETFAGHLEDLIGAHDLGMPATSETQLWLTKISDKLYNRLATMGIVQPRIMQASLVAYIDSYISSQATRVTTETVKVWKRAHNHAAAFFGTEIRLDEVTSGMAVDFRSHLFSCKGKSKGRSMSMANVNKTCSVLAQVYSHAVEVGLIAKNPFRSSLIKRSVSANPNNHFYVEAEIARQVILACADPEDAMMFALGRFAGLRLPSELLDLRWADIDFERAVMRVRSPKLRNRPASVRDVPIMPEVEQALLRARQEPNSEYVMPRLRLHKNLATRATRVLKSVGINPWVKPIQNLRASAETDWMNERGIETATAWCGNSQRVAIAHYHRVRKAACASEAALAARDRAKTGAATGAAKPVPAVTHSSFASSHRDPPSLTQPFGRQEIEATSDDPRELQETGAGGSDLLGSGPYWT